MALPTQPLPSRKLCRSLGSLSLPQPWPGGSGGLHPLSWSHCHWRILNPWNVFCWARIRIWKRKWATSLCSLPPSLLFIREQFTSQKGARSNAKRFLVIVTDGEKTGDPLNYAEVVQEADRAGITRFAVGVSSSLFACLVLCFHIFLPHLQGA